MAAKTEAGQVEAFINRVAPDYALLAQVRAALF
jgi:hypothetical protein